MLGHRFSEYTGQEGQQQATFENLLQIFMELLVHTDGDVSEALQWMNLLDEEYGLTDDNYGMGDFIEDLERKGYIERADDNGVATFNITAKSEQTIRQRSLEEIFGQLRKSQPGRHATVFSGRGDEVTADSRPFEFGDPLEDVNLTDSVKNAQINHGLSQFYLTEQDLEVNEREYQTQTSTVLMIDISHSMILYGEDRITPAKKVAMALSELITTRYPKDTLDIIVFGNDAWPINIKDLPYLQVGPYHTNTVAGLELSMDILRRRKTNNKQIFMITDGKPTCLREGDGYYKNSFGLDRKIHTKTLNLAAAARKAGIRVTTFMIAQDPYLQRFVREFTRANNGRAYYSTLNGLGEYILEDFVRNRTKRVR
jgi:uncharacterized protein with von Willebrand factor type A (vWA) domain